MRRRTRAAVAVLSVIAALLVVLGVLVTRHDGGSRAAHDRPKDGDAEPTADVAVNGGKRTAPVSEDATSGTDATDAVDPFEEMLARYRPGPLVSVEGLLPDEEAELPASAWLSRADRTIDTPWLVNRGRLRGFDAPASSDPAPDVPTIALTVPPGTTAGPLTIIPRVPTDIAVRIDDRDGLGDVRGALVEFPDYPGHFFVPMMLDPEVIEVDPEAKPGMARVHFAIDAPVPPAGWSVAPGQPFDTTIRVAVIDRAGNVSERIERPLRVMPVGMGDVEITLSMSRTTDLDLYVRDPALNTIYYLNTSSATGGRLDLDANAACSNNVGVNNEHIFWPAGGAYPGTYEVRVAHYQACSGYAPVDYRVTIRNCGETVVLAGRFEGGGDRRECLTAPGPSNANWCQHVVSFDVSACDG